MSWHTIDCLEQPLFVGMNTTAAGVISACQVKLSSFINQPESSNPVSPQAIAVEAYPYSGAARAITSIGHG